MSNPQTHSGFGSWWHLALRFFGALAPVGPRPASERWALDHLSEAERSLFSSMSGPDRRHAIGVAHGALDLAAEGGYPAERLPAGFVPAALLHDVGKIEAHIGTFGRVFATLAALFLGREKMASYPASTNADATRRPGSFARWRAKMALYLQHDRIGAGLLEGANSDDFTVRWAREHHIPEERWTLDHRLGEFLKQADGD